MKWIKVSDQLPENPGSPVNWSGVPMSGEVYSAECEMEIGCQKRKHDTTQSLWERWLASEVMDSTIWQTRQVAHLKRKDEIFPAANSDDIKEGLK